MKRITFRAVLIAIASLIVCVGSVTSASATTCKDISSRDWKLINKNPNAAKGQNIWVFGKITQFDDATGTSMFRANIDGVNHFDGQYFFGGDNSIVLGNSKTLSKFVNDDIFKACVTVKGSYTYTTALTKGSLSVPKLQAQSISYLGSTS